MVRSDSQVSYRTVAADTLRSFWTSTSIAGLSNAAGKTRHATPRVIWLVLSAVAICATTIDVIRVIQNYLEYPYTTQINLLHRSRVEFPAVTVCNQNRVNCLKLFAKMLKKASVSTEDDDFKRLVSMYNITHCGVDSLGCPRVRDLYHQFYMESPKGIPAVFRERDACLTCSEILLEYSGECQNSKSHAPKEYLNFLWQEGDCDSIVASPSFDWSPFPDAEQLRYYVMQESLERCPCPGNCHSFDEPLFADGSQLPESSNLSTPTRSRVKRQSSQRNKIKNYEQMTQSEGHDLKMNFLSMYMNLKPQMKKEIGHSFHDMIMDCHFLGRDCHNSSNFQYYHSPTHGNCYSFNEEGSVFTSLTGPIYSLSLVLDVTEDIYLPRRLTEKAGARVVVHKPKTQPMIDDEAIDVPPGMCSNIAVKEMNLNRLKSPFEADCTADWSDTSYSYDQDSDNDNVYTITECLQICLQRLFVDTCGCFHAMYPGNFFYMDTAYLRNYTCNLTSEHPDSACIRDTLDVYSVNPDHAECGCNVACRETQYPSFLSMAKWPPENTLAEVVTTYNRHHKNLLQLEVFFHTLNVDDVTQIPEFENAWSLVSSLGGALSLYMGISVFLLLEVLEFFIYLAFNTYLYAMGRYSAKKEDIHEFPSTPTSSDIMFVQRLYSAMGVRESKKQPE